MKEKDKSFKISFIIGIVFSSLGLIFSLVGWTSLGIAFFFFLPLAIGLSSGILPEPKKAALGTVLSLCVFSIFLIFTKIEGIICVIMALPILLIAIVIGWTIGRMIRSERKTNKEKLSISFIPITVFLVANFFELFSGNTMVRNEVSTSVELNSSNIEIYDNIIEVDNVDAKLGVLHHLGLPIPKQCVLTDEKIGGERLCIFDQGYIVETIERMERGKYLKMDITECNLGDRSWLKFDQDEYKIEKINDNRTRITRVTSYFSNLKPRKYWEFMESITIKAQQELVFRNLKKDLNSIDETI